MTSNPMAIGGESHAMNVWYEVIVLTDRNRYPNEFAFL